MPLLYALLGGLLSIVGTVVGRVLLALGLGYVSYSGMDIAINWLLDQIKSNINALPAQIVSFFAYMWVDKALSMIFSAFAVAMTIRMAGSAKLTKLVMKG